MDWFDALSPLDYRYYGRDKYVFEKISPYLSENARISYQAKVEAAYLKGLAKHGVASAKAAQEIQKAASNVSAEAVYQEEDRVRHDIRALVNVMKQDMGHSAKPFVHLGATSNDIINTADALRFQDFTKNALLPELLLLEKTIINIARTEKSTLQIGRTHGQHAEPLTFGFALAEYVSRLGGRIQALESAGNNLRGKISGAVGAYNATSLLVHDPEALEKDVLHSLGLKPASHSKQVVEPEHALDLLHAITSAFGVLANLADDLRHLQRTEIAEVGEAFGTDQVGSSTMPHKRNPITFENIKSLWKAAMPRMATFYADQISEHQRDLTNSASARFVPETLAMFFIASVRMRKALEKLAVDKQRMRSNALLNAGMIAAEPLYILLAAHGHSDAHEQVRRLTMEAQKSGRPLVELALADAELKPFLAKLKQDQLEVLRNPEKYTGIAAQKAENVCRHWERELKLK